MKNSLSKILMVCAIAMLFIGIISFLTLKTEYHITYVDEINTYDITQLKNNKVYVEFEDHVVCDTAPCPPIHTKNEIDFSNSNMKTVNNFIASLFNDTNQTSISLTPDDLNEEQLKIMQSIIHNHEEFLTTK
jgi:hypothetical protein